jgi:Fungalysin metallopeptidase (M36)
MLNTAPVLAFGLVVLLAAPASAQTLYPRSLEPLPRIDIRRSAPDGLVTASQREAAQVLEQRVPGVQIQWDALTGSPRVIQSQTNLLSRPVSGQAPLLLFVQENAALFGLTSADLDTLSPSRQVTAPGSAGIKSLNPEPLTHLSLAQTFQGRQVFPTTLVTSITGQGRILRVVGAVVKDLSAKVRTTEPQLTAVEALNAAASSIQVTFNPNSHHALAEPDGAERRQVWSSGDVFARDVLIRLLYYVASYNDIRLVWEVIASARNNPFTYQIFVDALTGDIVYRNSLTDQDSTVFRAYFRVFRDPPENPETDYTPLRSPAPLSPGPSRPDGSQGRIVPSTRFHTSGDPATSRHGWIAAATAAATTTGNNAVVFVYKCENDICIRDPHEQPTARIEIIGGMLTYVFDFPADFTVGPDTPGNGAAAAVNAFVVANWWHDRMYNFGFNEAAGNFQEDNGGAGGAGHDPVHINLHVGHNGSHFTFYPDGTFPDLNVSTWTGPSPNRDSGFDQELLIHELTHGLSNRIIGGGQMKGLSNLDGQPGGLAEGYSDFYALALLRGPHDNPDGTYAFAGYSTLDWNSLPPTYGWKDNYYYGLRHFPYTTDLCKNPFTVRSMETHAVQTSDYSPPYGVICASMPDRSFWLPYCCNDHHNRGEVWAATLWEVRRNLVSRYGGEIGNELALQLVTDSFFLLAPDPTIMEARDAIRWADLLRIRGENWCDIWRGFAKRGMGSNAATPPDATTPQNTARYQEEMFVEDFSLPVECILASSRPSSPGAK